MAGIGVALQLLGAALELVALIWGARQVERRLRAYKQAVASTVRSAADNWQAETQALWKELKEERRRTDENAWLIVALVAEVTRAPVFLFAAGVACTAVGVVLQAAG